MSERKVRAPSPYTKYQKAPHQYSKLYQDWHSAALSGKADEARRLGDRHSAAHGLKTYRKVPQLFEEYDDGQDFAVLRDA